MKGIRTSCASLFTRVAPEVNSGLKKINENVVPEVLEGR